MGDLEAEETARKRAEEKREQKRAAKKEKEEKPPEDKEEKTEVVAEKSKKKAPKTANKYRFPEGKKYLAVKSLVDPKKLYSVPQAIELVKKTSFSKFDGAVELHLNVTDKNLRGTAALPHGTGKAVRVKIADDKLIADLEKNGKIEFDILVASPDMMPKLAKVAKTLGPRGLMPNPKTGTIGENPEKLAQDLSKGQTQWKTQPDFPIVHTVIGRVSFEPEKLEENFGALLKSVGKEKIRSAFLKATMGPSIKLIL